MDRMTFTKCPQCDSKIDPFLDACPFCGCPKTAFEAVKKGKEDLAKRKRAAFSFWEKAKETLEPKDFQARVSFESMPQSQHLHTVEYWKNEESKLERNHEANIPLSEVSQVNQANSFLPNQAESVRKADGIKNEAALIQARLNRAQELEEIKSIERKAKEIEEKRQERERSERIESERKKREQSLSDSANDKVVIEDLSKSLIQSGAEVNNGAYGTGKVIAIERNNGLTYLKVSFGDKKVIYGYPSCFEKGYLAFGKAEKAASSTPFEKYKTEENEQEKQHFEMVLNEALQRSESSYKAPSSHMYPVQLYDEEMNANDFFDGIETNTMQSHWRDVANEVFFSKITLDGVPYYFGKSEIPGWVIDWRNPLASYYYQWSVFVHDGSSKLSVVRNFSLGFRLYRNFVDLFNKKYIEESEANSSDTLTSLLLDERLSKNTHDIIKTIARKQYDIITKPISDNLILLGCAGSGKTMVLFHRVAYLAFNTPNFKDFKVIVLSQSRLLNSESDELSKLLKLNQISRMTISAFMNRAGEVYSHISGSLFPSKRWEQETDRDDAEIKESDIPEKLFEGLKEMDDGGLLYGKFVFSFKNGLIEEIRQKLKIKISQEEFPSFKTLKLLSDARDFWSMAKKALGELPLENANAIIEEIGKLPISNEESDSKKLQAILTYIAMYSPFSFRQGNPFIVNKKIKQSNGQTVDSEGLQTDWGKMSEITAIRNLFDPGGKNKRWEIDKKLELFADYDKIEKKYEALQRDLQGDKNSLLFEKIDFLKTGHFGEGISDSSFFSLYCSISCCYDRLGPIVNGKSWLLIDEFQNMPLKEIVLVWEVCNKGSINLFGDFAQRITRSGIQKEEMQRLPIPAINETEINENFRNGRDICLYLNETFGLSMTPVGVPGTVRILAGDYGILGGWLSLNKSDDRIALIFKNGEKAAELIEKWCPNVSLNYISQENGNIERGMLNVINIADVKGLEFESVISYENDMSEEERFVSSSRALVDLLIVNDSGVIAK
jgi:hypothetical protein